MWRDPFLVSAVLGLQLEKYCQSVAVDFASSCSDLSIDPRIFSNLTGQLPCLTFALLLENLARQANDPLFGMRAGLYFDLGALGPLGYAIWNSSNLRNGWAAAKKYKIIGFNHSRLFLFENETSGRFVWELSPYAQAMPQITDFTLVLTRRTFAVFGDPATDLLRVNTTRAAPSDPSLHEELFGPVIWFNQKEDSYVVAANVLDRPNPQANGMMLKYMLLQCEVVSKLFRINASFESEVRKAILILLGTSELNLETIASQLATSPRSLQRKFEKSSKTFSQVLDETRKDYAEHLLRASNLSLETIAAKVGFKSASVLSRVSGEWFGMPPSEYRKSVVENDNHQSMYKPLTFASFFK